MHRNKSVDVHQFSMIPSAEIPRSSFRMESALKTAFDSGYLVPVYLQEVLPGDQFSTNMTAMCRLATPIFPIMDNLYLDSFFFFVPMRLVWNNWVKMMGEQVHPADSISYVIPTMTSRVSGYVPGTLHDYMGLPTEGQITPGNTFTHSALPLRCYNLIWNQWFRDENLQNSAVTNNTFDGPDLYTDFVLLRRGKRHDYFTGALPWTQKGNQSVQVPIAGQAPVKGIGMANTGPASAAGVATRFSDGTVSTPSFQYTVGPGGVVTLITATTGVAGTAFPAIFADLSLATNATVNQLRQSFQIQRLLERDARGGTRYTEIVRSHFGVISPDARLQRPEYLGGGSTPIAINPVAQTSNTPVSGTPQGNLSAFGTAVARHGFSQSFTEHGYILGLVNVRADLTYQQGVHKMWNRSTRYDFYWPVFAMLGEQAINNREIYADGSANDALVFGYQERWAEYRYHPSRITGLMKSTSAGTIDPWHLAQKFTALPTLNTTFIQDTPPLSRILAVGAGANGQQLIGDFFFSTRAARPMPLYSVPGMIDHF